MHGWEWFPPPDPQAWRRIDDPKRRLRAALAEMYAYYGRVGDAFFVLLRGRGRRRRLLLAAIDHALDLKTWHSLVRERGLSDEDAIDLLVAFVAAA